MVASRTQSQGVVVEILIDHKIGMNHNLESIRIDSTDSDSISVQIANRITMGESIRKATQHLGPPGPVTAVVCCSSPPLPPCRGVALLARSVPTMGVDYFVAQ